jgi:hypothetical protein
VSPFPKARRNPPRSFALLVLVPLLCLCARAGAKIPAAVLGTYVDGKDSDFAEGLSADLAQALAEDTSLLVFDLRRQNAGYLDSAHASGRIREPAFLAALSIKRVKWGLLMECLELKEEYRCFLEALDMSGGAPSPGDTLHVLLEAGSKRKLFGQAAAGAFARRLKSKGGAPPQEQERLGVLKLRTPARPAMLVRGLAILKKGAISELPLGSTLVIQDAPGPIAVSIENIHYILYPHSSYTYLLPKVVQLNEGTLGILKGVDSASIEGRLRSATAMDQSNLIWKTLSKVAAMDSSNLIWRGLGNVATLDSHNLILKNLQRITSLDSGNALIQTLGKVTAMDSSNLLLRTLSQVAAMDTSNLIWKGLGQVSALDSTNFLWRKLGEVATLDSNSVWSKLGLLAFQDQSVVLTPSFIVRGHPQAVLLRHEGNVSTLEVVKGSVTAQPLLTSGEPASIGAMRVARTRGYALKQERLNPVRADRLLREFEALDPNKGSRPFALLLPGRLFGAGAALRTADRGMQSFVAGESRELDMEMDVLSSEKEGWSDFPGTLRTGSQESGCFLCSPGRLDP